MLNRSVRFITRDKQVVSAFIIFVSSVLLFFFLLSIVNAQGRELNQLKNRNELIASIPQLEKELKSKEELVSRKSKIFFATGVKFVLTGILVEDKSKLAIINETICREGTYIDGFIVAKITLQNVTLYNCTDGREIKLEF